MVFTPSGIEMLLSALQPLNAFAPISSIYAGSVTVESEVQPSKSFAGMFFAMQVRFTLKSEAQFANAASPIEETFVGIVTPESFVQP